MLLLKDRISNRMVHPTRLSLWNYIRLLYNFPSVSYSPPPLPSPLPRYFPVPSSPKYYVIPSEGRAATRCGVGYMHLRRRIDASDRYRRSPVYILSSSEDAPLVMHRTRLSPSVHKFRTRLPSARTALTLSHVRTCICVSVPARYRERRDDTPYVSYFRAALNEPCRPAVYMYVCMYAPTSLPSKQVQQNSTHVAFFSTGPLRARWTFEIHHDRICTFEVA